MTDVASFGAPEQPSDVRPVTWHRPAPEDGGIQASAGLDALSVLFASGRRAGWMAYDWRHLRQEFPEPRPEPTRSAGTRANRLDGVLGRLRGRPEALPRIGVYGFVLGVILATGLAAGSASDTGRAQESRAVLLALAAGGALAWWARRRFPRRTQWSVVMAAFAAALAMISDLISFRHGAGSLPIAQIMLFGLGLGVLAPTVWRLVLAAAQAAVRRSIAHGEGRAHGHALDRWQTRRQAFDLEQDEQIRGLRMFQWGPASVPDQCRRFDVFGGSPSSWRSLVTIFGASLLGSGVPVTVLDLSRRRAVDELVRLAARRGSRADVQILPRDSAKSDLLRAMNRDQLIGALVESARGGTADPARGAHMADYAVLEEVCAVLAGPAGDGCVSLARIALGLRAAMGDPVRDGELAPEGAPPGPGALTPQEHAVLAAETFGPENRRDAMSRLRELRAAAQTLGALRLDPVPRPPADLRVIQAWSAPRGARADFIKELIVASQVSLLESGAVPVGTLILAGADNLGADLLEHLATVCADVGVPLVMMFEHLRGDAGKVVGGGGLVGFMRLGNHQEAAAAADFIGREHKMVFSTRTWTTGENESHAVGTGEATSTGRTDTTGDGRSVTGEQVDSTGPRRPGGLFTKRTYATSTNTSRATSTQHTASTSETETTGTSTAQTDAVQRVHEHRVAPETFQHMPDYAMLLVDHLDGRQRVRSAETDPRIASLPGVSAYPLPDPIRQSEATVGAPRSAIDESARSALDPRPAWLRQAEEPPGWPTVDLSQGE